MKKLCFIMLLFAVLIGCDEIKDEKYPKYEYTIDYYVPDSIMPKAKEWIKETIRATNQHLSAGDYEDVWSTIRVAKGEGLELFEIRTEGLRIKSRKGVYWEFVPQERMTCNELKIFKRLRIGCK